MSLTLIFLAGLGTVLTPCVLPLIPIYLGALAGSGDFKEIEGQGLKGRLRILGASLSFILGFTIVFTSLGLVSGFFGSALANHRLLLTQLGGLLVFLFGLKFLGLLDLGFLDREARFKMPKAGNFAGNAAFGVVFALGWTPCIGPVLGSVLAYTASTASNPWVGASYLLVYSAGFAIPLLATALLLSAAVSYMDRIKTHMQKIQKIGGVALMFIGVLLITGNISLITGGGVAATPTAERCTDLTEPGVPTLVQFTSPGCAICKEMEPVIETLSSDCAGMKVRIREVVVEDPGRSDLFRQYRVVGYPTYIFLDEEGLEAARLVGRQKLETLRQHMSLITGEKCPNIGRKSGSESPDPETGSLPADGPGTELNGKAGKEPSPGFLCDQDSDSQATGVFCKE